VPNPPQSRSEASDPAAGPRPARPAQQPRGLAARVAPGREPRPAWVEVNLGQLRRNYDLLMADAPDALRVMAVVKDEAYGHGAAAVARVALAAGAESLAVHTLDEAVGLRDAGIGASIILLGERHPAELEECVRLGFTLCLGDLSLARRLGQLAVQSRRLVPVHLEIDTGLSRYGVGCGTAPDVAIELSQITGLELAGIMTHFAMSDETDTTFALLQLDRFRTVLTQVTGRGLVVPVRHLCNTGGFLDLPQAHYELVRLGILPLGVYPSLVCRRIAGIRPVMTVKANLVVVRSINAGDHVGYGLRWTAPNARRIAVLPVGYGDGYPRLRNAGHVLVRGQAAPILGSVAMDSLAVDVTHIPDTHPGDEAVLMGGQGEAEISARDLAQWKGSVCYDILAGWRSRLPRRYLDDSSRS